MHRAVERGFNDGEIDKRLSSYDTSMEERVAIIEVQVRTWKVIVVLDARCQNLICLRWHHTNQRQEIWIWIVWTIYAVTTHNLDEPSRTEKQVSQHTTRGSTKKQKLPIIGVRRAPRGLSQTTVQLSGNGQPKRTKTQLWSDVLRNPHRATHRQ
uniref:Uncharacterized protein n=1 Tax=Glossina pallidipes TaxID=7398 RepID=A0A1B0A3A5_GLOPL